MRATRRRPCGDVERGAAPDPRLRPDEDASRAPTSSRAERRRAGAVEREAVLRVDGGREAVEAQDRDRPEVGDRVQHRQQRPGPDGRDDDREDRRASGLHGRAAQASAPPPPVPGRGAPARPAWTRTTYGVVARIRTRWRRRSRRRPGAGRCRSGSSTDGDPAARPERARPIANASRYDGIASGAMRSTAQSATPGQVRASREPRDRDPEPDRTGADGQPEGQRRADELERARAEERRERVRPSVDGAHGEVDQRDDRKASHGDAPSRGARAGAEARATDRPCAGGAVRWSCSSRPRAGRRSTRSRRRRGAARPCPGGRPGHRGRCPGLSSDASAGRRGSRLDTVDERVLVGRLAEVGLRLGARAGSRRAPRPPPAGRSIASWPTPATFTSEPRSPSGKKWLATG